MNRPRFPLSSEQLELLLAFEGATGLAHLAEIVARDASVVSRNLQRIAEDQPVLRKVKGRWELTPLGLQVNRRTRHFLEEQAQLFASAAPDTRRTGEVKNAVLIVLNAQRGLLDATQEGRNNLEAEANIARLLTHWREQNRRIVHVKHVSENPGSIFFREGPGADFLDCARPAAHEPVIEKTKSSAFTGTSLEELLGEDARPVLVGFTASECIDATARDATARGFEPLVIGDATATFDLRDPSGKLIKAERLHRLTLTHIHAFYGKVITTEEWLQGAPAPSGAGAKSI